MIFLNEKRFGSLQKLRLRDSFPDKFLKKIIEIYSFKFLG